jgi:hypothetical protein
VAAQRELTVRPDAKGRITLGSLAKGVSSFQVREQPDGSLLLEPFKEVPAREAWLYENPEALDSLRKGLADAEAGRVRKRGSFSSYVTDEAD